MLRCICLFDAQALNQRAGRQFSVAKLLNDGDSRRVGKSLKEFGFELAEGVWHCCYYYILNFEYNIALSGQEAAPPDSRFVSGLASLSCDTMKKHAPVAQLDRAFASGAK